VSKLLDAVRDSMVLKRYAPSTIESYTNWILRFILYHNKRHPRAMGAAEIGAFLSFLAKEKRVSGSTQNQALQAIIYLYKHVLQIEIGNLDFARASKDKRLPTILTRQEVQSILTAMPDNELRLMAQLCYGSGLRLFECLRLRIKDVDLASQRITVRDTKSNRDRHTILPTKLVVPLAQQIARVTPLHKSDIANGIGVHLPDAIAVKYKNASRKIGWRYLFPSKSIAKGEHGEPMRHHIHISSLQKEFHRAVQRATPSVRKPASIHMLRHAFATHLIESRVGVERVQQMLGHKDLQTTMIYVPTTEVSGKTIKSPLDT
jgi:integron integrase